MTSVTLAFYIRHGRPRDTDNIGDEGEVGDVGDRCDMGNICNTGNFGDTGGVGDMRGTWVEPSGGALRGD